MRAPVLLSFAAGSALIAISIELLAQQSSKAGGLSLTSDPDTTPTVVRFAYLFLPTIVAVVYGMIWNWIDLDVKRIQPWLEMSASGGALGQDSLFLEYPYDFMAFVPFRAARRR
jgi:hypothetical protein